MNSLNRHLRARGSTARAIILINLAVLSLLGATQILIAFVSGLEEWDIWFSQHVGWGGPFVMLSSCCSLAIAIFPKVTRPACNRLCLEAALILIAYGLVHCFIASRSQPEKVFNNPWLVHRYGGGVALIVSGLSLLYGRWCNGRDVDCRDPVEITKCAGPGGTP